MEYRKRNSCMNIPMFVTGPIAFSDSQTQCDFEEPPSDGESQSEEEELRAETAEGYRALRTQMDGNGHTRNHIQINEPRSSTLSPYIPNFD